MNRTSLTVFSVMICLYAPPYVFAEESDPLPSTTTDRRNPFTLDQESNCGKQITEEGERLSRWRLSGIIGDGANRRGWMQSPSGEWMKVFTQAKLPLTYWKFSEMGLHSALFSPQEPAIGSCNTANVIELKIRK